MTLVQEVRAQCMGTQDKREVRQEGCIAQAEVTVVAVEHVHWAVRISLEGSVDPWSDSNPPEAYLYFPVCPWLLQKPDSRLCDMFRESESRGAWGCVEREEGGEREREKEVLHNHYHFLISTKPLCAIQNFLSYWLVQYQLRHQVT